MLVEDLVVKELLLVEDLVHRASVVGSSRILLVEDLVVQELLLVEDLVVEELLLVARQCLFTGDIGSSLFHLGHQM